MSEETVSATKRVFIKSYGCQMNVYDSQRMAELLSPFGYAAAGSADEADLVILNTCHIREKATEKIYSELGRLRALKQARCDQGGRMLLAVAGCVAQAEGAEIIRRQGAVDLVVGPQAYHRLPELIAKIHRGSGEALAAGFDPEEKFDALPAARRASGPSAFLTIQEGCDRFCTFCVVPYTRGPEYSRPVEAISAEARDLAQKGVREITLLGQNVNAWRNGEEIGLAELITILARIPGLDRIRYTTSHPADMDEALIRAHGEVPELMPYLHLPVQSGSDRVLRAMNRSHTAGGYLRIIERLRTSRPDIAISGDFIVGFPGETEADFAATLELVREADYAAAFSFKYSRRPGTPAAAIAGQLSEEVKEERLSRLQTLLARQQERFNRGSVGCRTSVLFEKPGRRRGQIVGRTPHLQAVHCQGPPSLIGDIAPVLITRADAHSLAGEIDWPPTGGSGRDRP
ncbi:MAG: tRNA (N6-isopentenyl adenosine(37)-C2)-methylthiotransferase MiaB [Caulobacteraceae bacterium]